MIATVRTLFALMIAGVAAPAVRADDEKPKKPAEGTKPIIIQLDASKLPPDVLKQLLQLSKPDGEAKPGAKPEKPTVKPGAPDKPGVKPEKTVKQIGLSDAVAIAEKIGQGTAMRAERKGDGFVVDVQSKKGDKATVTLDATGKPAGDEKGKGDPNEKQKGEQGETGSKAKDKGN